MTEEEWLECTDPRQMLGFVRDRASERKLRLFACACCRRIWNMLPGERSRHVVELVERYADGQSRVEEVNAAAVQALIRSSQLDKSHQAVWAAFHTASEDVGLSAPLAVQSVLYVLAGGFWGTADAMEVVGLVKSVHDIFGNPFHAVAVAPAILTWNDATVVRLARAAYEERQMPAGTLDSSRLAILADALEEAGCTDANFLGHLRGPGPYVRGCWPVDLCLVKS